MSGEKLFASCELLCPAGSMQSLETALYFGADAVYCGGPFMQLRAENAGFSRSQLLNAVEYTHSLGKRLYVTVNSFAVNEEIDKLGDYAKFLYEIGVDAAIVSDLGAIAQIKSECPELCVHVSTQANIQNYKTALVYYNMGAKRVVLGREMTLGQIAELRDKTPKELEIEAFVHGAMCMAYSGRCLISSFVTGKSGNRGECTQPCRWMYTLVEEKRPEQPFTVIEQDGASAILSSHDLCCIDFLDKIAEAGVTSFKIEGRMKSPYYVATVTNAYRKRMDGTASAEELRDELEAASHRPYSSGFYFGELKNNHSNSGEYIQNRKFIAVVLQKLGEGEYVVEMRNKFSVGDSLEILSPKSVGESFTVTSIKTLEGESRETAQIPTQKLIIETHAPLYEGDILRKRLAEG